MHRWRCAVEAICLRGAAVDRHRAGEREQEGTAGCADRGPGVFADDTLELLRKPVPEAEIERVREPAIYHLGREQVLVYPLVAFDRGHRLPGEDVGIDAWLTNVVAHRDHAASPVFRVLERSYLLDQLRFP